MVKSVRPCIDAASFSYAAPAPGCSASSDSVAPSPHEHFARSLENDSTNRAVSSRGLGNNEKTTTRHQIKGCTVMESIVMKKGEGHLCGR